MADSDPIDYVAQRVARGLGEPIIRPSTIAPEPDPDPDPDEGQDILFGERLDRLESAVEGLKRGSEMSNPPTREEIQAQIAASEARGETKFARLEGKLDLVLSKLDDAKDDGRHTRNNVILVGVSLALLIIGSVAIAPVIFDLGSKFRETVTKEVQEQVQHAAPKPAQ